MAGIPRSRAQATRRSILSATRDLLLTGGELPTVGEVAARAGVSRLTVYQHFGSHRGLLAALAGTAVPPPAPNAAAGLRDAIRAACERWAADPALFRSLPAATDTGGESARELAGRLAGSDRLRPGCSIREAEDVIAVVTSFAAFDRLHQDGRRPLSAVVDMLHRMAASILSDPAYD